jgi:hypothetical protein
MVLQTSAHFEPVAWWFTRKKIGRGLREHYEFAGDLPPRLLALIKELDGKSAIQFTKARPTDRMPDPNQPSGRTT